MNMDWKTWVPKEKCVLCFVLRDGAVLLIRKKRGLGAGKINGPGGRIDPGEKACMAAVRECEEELHITPQHPQLAGELRFQFVDGHSLHCSVFKAADFTGTPEETEEAVPLWVLREEIPYAEMWADDTHWFPHLLAGKFFSGRFVFDGDTLLDGQVEFPSGPSCLVEMKQCITAAIC